MIFTIRLFSSFRFFFGEILTQKPNQVFVDFVSIVFSVMCILTGLRGLLGTN